MMKKRYVFIILFLLFIVLITIIGSFFVSGDKLIDEDSDILIMQRNKEIYFNVYGYDINNPNVVVDPYGNSPLTALVMFTSRDYSEVEVVIKSKNSANDIAYKFEKDKYHMIPIYGLYAGYNNTVIIRCEGIEKIININTDKLPDDFVYVNDMTYDNFMFYNINYPYIVDINGDVRWYLNSNYYGDITILDNSSFVIGSDRYNERGNVISFYKMNYLGKIYNEYIVNEYYGISSLYNDNILILSNNILLMDLQTGEVINEYANDNGYDYLNVYDNNIVVGKEDIFYVLKDNNLEQIDYSKEIHRINFYNNASNYNTLSSNRFGHLDETKISEEKITLIGYDRLDKLDNISVVREADRIKIINNTGHIIYVILDKFMDKRIYDVDEIKYINLYDLEGKYTFYFKINNKIYKTNYYVEV